jgi:hypothetical protein
MKANVKTALVAASLIVLIVSIAGCTVSPSVQPSEGPSAGGSGWGDSKVQASASIEEPSTSGGSNVQTSRLATAISRTWQSTRNERDRNSRPWTLGFSGRR